MGYEKDDLIKELWNFKSSVNEYVWLCAELTSEKQKSGEYPKDDLSTWLKHQKELQILYGKLEHIIVAISGKTIEELPFEKALSTGTLLDMNSAKQFCMDSMDMIPVLIGKVELLSDNQCRKLINKSDAEILIEHVPTAFIAHGGESEALDKLQSFLQALGVKPIVAELEPSGGRWIEQHVDKCMSDADCAIILATYGHIIDVKTGDKHPRLNVMDEFGRCRTAFENKRTIILLEEGVSLSTNVSGIVRVSFTSECMDRALIKVASELTEIGLIRAIKAE